MGEEKEAEGEESVSVVGACVREDIGKPEVVLGIRRKVSPWMRVECRMRLSGKDAGKEMKGDRRKKKKQDPLPY